MAARALVADASEKLAGENDSLPYLATRSQSYSPVHSQSLTHSAAPTPTRSSSYSQTSSQTYTPSRSSSYSATRAMPSSAFTSTVARRGLSDQVEEITIDEFAAPRRSASRRALDPATAARNAVLVAAIAGPVAAAAEAMRAEQEQLDSSATESETTAILTAGSSPAPKSSAFVARRVRRRKATMGILGLTAALTFTGVGMSVQAATTDEPFSPNMFIGGSAEQMPNAVRADDISRNDDRVDINDFPASQPAMGLESKPTIDGVTAPGQNTPYTSTQAMETAQSMVGNQNYGNMCLALVSAFYGYSSAGIASAQDAAGVISEAGMMHTDMTDIPVGALIWYDGLPSGNPFGHVAMYAGDGMVYSNGAPTGVGLISINTPADDWHEPIIGWSAVWLPNATK